MKIVTLILSLLLLTSCSNPDTSGGVTLSRGGGGDWDNTFPNGSCKGPDQFDNQGSKTGCGWVHSDEGSHYITSCSNPETWDGVTLSRGCGNDSTNVFPYGSCQGPSADAPSSHRTGCGWISAHGKTHYIMPHANLRNADLRDAALLWANLRDVDLYGAELSGAELNGVKANSRTICPNGKKWGTTGNNCGF